MNNIPLSDASMSEVLARVAYRLIERRLALYGEWITADDQILSSLHRQLARCGWNALSSWVSAYCFHYARGEEVAFTRTRFIFRARLGYDFRSVMFDDYKAPRRRDPRVTNRGVTTNATKRGLE